MGAGAIMENRFVLETGCKARKPGYYNGSLDPSQKFAPYVEGKRSHPLSSYFLKNLQK